MAQVTPRQLRYWEQKGYLKSHQSVETKVREFSIYAVFRAILIKHYLDEGFTLNVAAQKVVKKVTVMKTIGNLMRDRFKGIEEVDGQIAINLGYFDETHRQILYAIAEDEQYSFKLVETD